MQAVADGVTNLNGRHIETVLAALAHYCEEVPVFYRLRPNLRDASDDMVFECAANFNAEAIITHNVGDFTDAELIYPIQIMRPGKFIRRVRSEQ